MAAPAKENKPQIVVVAGGSGNGKSEWLKQRLRKAKRVLVWDPKGEYARADVGFVPITSCAELTRTLAQHPGNKPGRFTFIPYSMDWFDYWARAAHAWGHADIVAEETADVTTSSKAPQGWGMVIRRGGDRGLRVYGVTQRPCESDKTIMGNRTLVHCHAMPRPKDRRYMADEMGLDQSVLDRLQPFDWVEVDQRGTLTHGKVKKSPA